MDGRLDRWLNEKEEREGNRRLLRRGAREAAGPFIAGLRLWDLFSTQTYDRRRYQEERILGAMVVPKISTFVALRHGRLFLAKASKALQRPLPAVLAVEAHKDGSAHLHGLFDVSGLGPGDIRVLWSIWYKEHGYIRLEEPRSHYDVSAYCGKYMAKDFSEMVFSRDLNAPLVKRGVLWS